TGYILSCAHVVRDADSITVTLPDARFFSGKVVSVDHYSDLALLKIEGKNLPVAELGNSDTLMPGQWALALGNPFGFAIPDTKPLITNSIISGLHQFLPQTEDRTQAYHDLIQINASISPGLSGGPLVDKNGNIVGINAAMAHNKAGADSVGFAIPINYAKKMIEKMVEGEEILYRKLGIKVHDLTPALANYFGLQKPHGVLVEEILPDSPAVSAGIEEKDVIIRFGNQRISNTNSFINIVKELKKDSNNKIKVIRRTIAREFKITARDIAISELPTNIQPKYAVQPAKNVKEIKNDFLWRGMLITDLPDSLKDTSGVYVAKVNTGSSAEAGGITTGNIITFIDTMEIQNLNDLREAVKKISGNALVKTSQGYLVVPE
ncbi:MAG: trypsin-like peptidase domain-containing protein, partial [Candidatus Heimdallarchaeota archaeon]|nr:trypsin-like peptidase domain-containing protein [Candidatus Heimdallarchaeota archaeon]